MDTGQMVGCAGCGSNAHGSHSSGGCTCSSGSIKTTRSCGDDGLRYRHRSLTGQYITAKVLDVRESMTVSKIKMDCLSSKNASFHDVCVDGSLSLKNGAPFKMTHGVNNSITLVDISSENGVNVNGSLSVKPGASNTELSVTNSGTFVNGFMSVVQNEQSDPARMLIANEAPNQPQQLVIATEYTGTKPPDKSASGGDTLGSGPAFALTVDPQTESIELAPTNSGTKSGLSYSQFVYVPNRPEDPPASQGKHVFVGDFQVFPPPRGTTAGDSNPIFNIEGNSITMRGDVSVINENDEKFSFSYVFPWQETLSTGAATFHGPVQQISGRSDGGPIRTVLANNSQGSSELVLATQYSKTYNRYARHSEFDDLNSSAASAFKLAVTGKSDNSSHYPYTGSLGEGSFVITPHVSQKDTSGNNTTLAYIMDPSSNTHTFRGDAVQIENGFDRSLSLDKRGTKSYRPSEYWNPVDSDAGPKTPAMITKLKSTFGNANGGLFLGSAEPESQDIPREPLLDNAHIIVGGYNSTTEKVVEIFQTLKIGPLTIQAKNASTVEFAMDGEPYMIFNESTIQITKGLQAAELYTQSIPDGDERQTIRAGGVSFATIPVVHTGPAELDETGTVGVGDMFMDGNGFLMVRRPPEGGEEVSTQVASGPG